MYINNNFYSNTLLSGSNDKDTIINGNSHIALSSNEYSKVTIDAKGGNDSIISDLSGLFRTGSKNKIDGGSGDDTIDNDGNEATVTGGTGNDSIINYGATVRIDAGEGNDTISNKINYGLINDPVDHVTIIGGTGNDSIYNSGHTVSVDAGAGNDSITNGYNTNDAKDNVTLNAGDGNDYIYNHNDGDVTTILGGSGNDTIENNGDTISIDAGDGDDSIFSYSFNGTIRGGAGNDKISLSSSGRDNLVDGGEGKDTIRNEGSNNTILGGAGNDSIYNIGSNVSIDAGDGNDTINISSTSKNITALGGSGNDIFLNWGSDNRVDGGAGNDSIANSEDSKNSSLIGGAGNDTIRETSKYGSTIDGGGGNDVVSLVSGSKNALIVYRAGDGNDTISGFNTTSTLSVVGGNFSVARSGNDAIITVGDEKITLRGAATLDAVNINDKKVLFVSGTYSNSQSNVILVGNDSPNSIANYVNNVTIQAAGGNDSIYTAWNSGDENISIDAGTGNDYIYTNPSYNLTIEGGSGDDTIDSRSGSSKIDGGAGNDSISNYRNNTTIEGGTGNDSIYISWNFRDNSPYDGNFSNNILINYTAGDGNDFIKGFRADSTLSLAGTGYISTKSGNDVILTVSDGKITLSGAANLSKINIVEKPLNIANSKSNISVIGTGANDTIKNTGEKVVVVAKGGNDSINNGGKNSTVDASDGNDIISNNGANSSLSGGSGSDTLANSSDNVTINAGSGNDSLSIGKASGNLIQYQNGDGDDVITSFSEKSSISVGGAAYALAKLGDNAYVKVGDGLITIRGGADLAKINVIGTLDKSKNFNNNKDNTLVIGNEQDNNITNTGNNTTILANSGKDSVYNTGANAKIYGGDGNDTLRNFQANSVLIDGSNGDDSIYDKSWYSTISAGSGSDTILIEGASVSANGGTGNDSIKNAGDSNITLAGGKGNDTISNAGAKTIFKYELGDGDDVIEGFKSDSTLDISEANYATEKSGNDWLVYVGDGNEITLKGAGNLSKINVRGMEEKAKNLKNTKDNTSMVGSNYADTLDNTGKNVTIMGNAGNDSIKSTGANSSIDGSRGNDKIENGGASSIVEGGLGNDSIYNNRGDKSLVEGGAGNDTITNQARNATVLGGEGNDIFQNSNYGENSTLDGGAGNDTIRNTVAQVSISGGAGNDSIDNTDKQHDNSKVTINAGTGNDYIKNDSQNILFQYKNGDGFDLIDGFNETSTLSVNGGVKDDSSLSVLGGTQATTTKSGDNIIVTVGEGKVTLSGAAKLSKVNVVETPMNFSNSRSNVTINATNANDTITNSGEKVAIFALGGKDSIINNNQGVNSTITGGKGDDKISNNAKNVTITSESGKNDIRNEAASVSIAGGADSDSIFNHGEEVTVAGGAGADIIENYSGSDKAQIDGGAGDDSIDNAGHNATIQGGAGLDTITNNSGTAVLLDGGAGNDIISIKGAYQNTISGGAGDDTIQLDWSSNNALIVYDNGDGTTVNPGDGNDLIQGFNATSTLQLGGGSSTYSTVKSGDDIIVNVGIDKITLEGAANLSEVHIAGRTKLNLNNTQSAVEILGSSLNDSVRNEGFYVTIKAYGGHDTIRNYAREAVIDGGKGEDFIENRNANSVTITAGAEDDVIVSRGGYRNTINAGTGNDTIDVTGNDEDFIRYKVGDGNDYIIGFNESSSLRIAGEVFSTAKSNQDVIVTVGDDKITLEGAATLSHLNILGVEDVHLNITNRTDNTLLVGTIFNDTISNLGNNVSILARDGDDSIKNGQLNESCINVTIDTGKGNDTIINENGDTVSIDAGAGNDYIENRNEALTVKAGDGDDKIFNRYSGINSIIDAGAGNDSIDNRASNTTISGGAGNDTIYNNWDIKNGVALSDDNDDGSNVLFNYHTGDGNDIIYGFKNNSTLSIDDIEGAYSTSISGNDIIVTVGDSNVTLKNAANLRRINIVGVTPVNINNSTDDTLIVGTKANDTIWNKGGDNVTIQALGGNDTINNYRGDVTIDAGAGNDTIRNSGSSVMVDGGAGNDYINNYGNEVTINGGEGSDSIYNGSFISAISIAGGAGNDSIRNLGSNTTIEGGDGNDTIQNENDYVTINGGVGNDLINNSKEDVLFTYANGDGFDVINGFNANSTLSISGGTYSTTKSGSDIIVAVGDGKITLKGAANLSKVNIACEENKPLNISNSTNGTLIVGTDNNDSIANTGDSVTIAGGKGNDTLWNEVGGAPSAGKEVSLNGGAGNDFISNDGDSSTVQGGADNDTVQNWGAKSSLVGGAGNDSIKNEGDSVTIAGGAGNDTLWNDVGGAPSAGKEVSLNGGAGNDFISNDGANATLIGGADNDTVQNWGANSTISGGAGSDSIWNDGTNVSINAGAGNDTISLSSDSKNNLIQLRAGDGSDLITGFNATSTLSISGAGYSSEKSGNDIIVTVGDDKITLQGAANLSAVNIAGEKLPLTISNSTNGTLIVGTDKNDSISNDGASVTIDAGAGNDKLSNWGTRVKIYGDAGNDSITNAQNGYYATINGGVGDDSIKNFGSNLTISGGAGNDTIFNDWDFDNNAPYAYGGSNVLFVYNAGDGNDIINGFRADSTLSIAGGRYYSQKSGNDIIVTVGKENITLTGAATLSKVNIAGSQGIDVDDSVENRQKNILIVGNDSANTIENSWEASNVTIQANGGNDSIYNEGYDVTIDAGAGNDSIDNPDYSTSNILINAGAGNDSINNWSDETTINAGDGNDTILNLGEYRNVSVDAGAGNDYIETRNYGVSITGGKGDDSIYNDWNFTNNAPNVPSDYDDDDGNYVQFNYTAGDGNDVIYGFNETDTLNISGGIYSTTKSGNDIIVMVGDDKITLQGAASLSTVNIAGSQGINVDKNYSNSQNNVLIVGNDSANTISNSGENVTIQALGGNDSISNNGASVSIEGGADSDTIENWGSNTTIDSGAGNDSIYTNKGSNMIVNGGAGADIIESFNGSDKSQIDGGVGDDSIKNFGSNTTISGGAGNDTILNNWNFKKNAPYADNDGSNVVFVYNNGDGNDIINGFRANSTLSIAGAGYYSQKSGDDIIVTVGDGKITLSGAANLSKVNIAGTQGIYVDKNYSNSQNNVLIVGNDSPNSISNTGNNVTILTKGGNDSIQNWGSNTTIDSGAGNDSIYTNNGSNMIVNGGDGKDKIINYAYKTTVNGGAGDDSISNYRNNTTISGGTGKDSIYISWNFRDNSPYDSNTSNNILINYTAGDGNDIINGFRADSTLSIAGGRYYSQKSGNDIIVTVGDGKITLKGAANLSKVNIAGTKEIYVDKKYSNVQNNVLIVGNDSANTIENYGNNVTILANGGNDTIENNGVANVTIDAGDGEDSIFSYSDNSTIRGGAGNDKISLSSSGRDNLVDGGAGNDTIRNEGSNNTILGGAGDDSVYNNWNFKKNAPFADNDGSNVVFVYNKGDGNDIINGFKNNSTLSIAGGRYYSQKSGNDIIVTVGEENITLTGAASLSTVNIAGSQGIDVDDSLNNTLSNILIVGNDSANTIANSGANVTIQAKGGNDSISNTGASVSIDGGDNDDIIRNYVSNVTISGGADNDSIFNYRDGTNSAIFSGEGNDSIANGQAQATLNGEAGNDYIYNDGNKVTIDAGSGNDTIQNNGISGYGENVLIIYNAGDGNDLIRDFRSNSTLSIAGSRYYSTTSGKDIIVHVGKENITLTGAASLSAVNIAGSQGIDVDDSLNNTLSNILIVGNDSANTIANTGANVTIQALGGNDSIVSNGKKAMISGGAGDDSISNPNKGGNSTILGGADNDSIYNAGSNVTISGGTGDDSVYNNWEFNKNAPFADNDGSNVVFVYNKGDGNDIINGFKNNSTLSIAGSRYYSQKSGNDIIVHVGEENITLTGAATLSKVNIAGSQGIDVDDSLNNTLSNILLIGNDLDNTIANSGKNVTIQANGGDDSISNSGTITSVDAGAGDDSIINGYNENGKKDNVTLNAGDGDDYIYNHVDGDYTTLLGGAGNDTIENKGDTISIDAGDGDDSIFSYSFNSTITGGKGDDTITLSSDGKNNLIVYNEGDGDDIIYGFDAKSTLKIGDGTATCSSTVDGSDIIITVGENKITLVGAATLSALNIAASLAPIEVTSSFDNVQNGVLIIGNDEDNTIGNSGSNVTILANGGNDSISNSGSNSLIDAGKGDDTITLSSNGQNNLIVYNKGDGNDLIQGFNAKSSLSISGGYLSQKSGSDIIVTVRGSEITLKGAANLSTVNIIGDKYAPLNLKNYDDNVSVVGSQFDDTIENHGDNVTIVAREDDDYITNEALNTSILGGDGNDSVINVGSNITIDSGAGNDSIENYSKFSVIETGDGDDTIDNSQFGDNVAISSGAGNDSIESWGVNATISGGIGDDTINIAPTSDIALIQYTAGDGNDLITGFNGTSTLSISGGKYDLERTGADIIITVGDDKITLKGSASLSAPHIIGEPEKSKQYIENDQDGIVITGTELNDTIDNTGENVTILALEGDDSINNHGNANNALIDTADGNDTIRNDHAEYVTINAGVGNDSIRTNANRNVISAGDGNDTIKNEWALFNTIDAGAGDDSIYIDASTTVSAGLGNDTITLDSASDDEILITYMPGDGDDLIQGFNEGSTLSIGSDFFTSIINGDDVIVTVEEGNITLEGAAEVDPLHIVGTQLERGTYVTFTVEDSEVTYETDAPESIIKRSYKFNDKISLLTLNDKIKDYIVKVKNQEETSVKVNWHYGTASLSSASVLGYRLSGQKNNVTLTSKNYKDNVTFSEDVNFKYDDITANILSGGGLSTQGENAISFDDDSSASVTAPEGSTIGINAGTFTVNDLPIKSDSGAGTITVEKDGLSFYGYGVQFVHLEIAKESYFEQVTPMTVAYNSNDESYSILNTACVKTLAADFTKLTFDISVSGDENYAYYKVNDVAFLVASDADNINVVEAKDSTFKIQGKGVDTKKISRVTIDERITFTGTEIDFDDVKTIYAQGKNVGYSLDGKEVTIDNAATVTTAGAETKTFNCAAGSYTVNGRTFETSAALTFTADTNEIKIPLSDAQTEIYFDGVTISGVSDGGELVFDLANQKIFVPNGAIVNVESSEAVKLNLVAGSFTVNDNAISTGVGIEITADKDNIKVPLSENAVTINSAAITGTKDATIDKNKIITLSDGALVENISENIFRLAEKNSAASFGNANKKVKLTEDGNAYIKYVYENGVSVGLNSVIFENVEILGNDAWTVETAGANGIDKITGITDGATISASTAEGVDGDLNFYIETEGNGSFTICGQKFISTGDAENIFTVSNSLSDDTSTAAVTAITKKLGTVDGNFERGIQVNPEGDKDKYVVKATNNDKDIEIALDTAGKMSVESIEDGANVEKYGQAEKVITVKNQAEYSLQIADYKYTVNGDLDEDGITFLLVDDDFKVRTLYENGLVTRYNVNDAEQLVWTWSIEQDKWIRESEQPIIEDAPYEITINADKTLTLKANGVLVDPYSNQVITSPISGAAVENDITVTSRAIEGVTTFINNSDTTPNIFVEDDQIITAFAPAANVTVDKTSYTLNSETATGTTFKLDGTRRTLNIADGFNVVYNNNFSNKTDVKLLSDNNDMYLSCYANVTAPEGKNIDFDTTGFYTVNEIQFRAEKGSKAQTVDEGVKLDLSTGTFQYDVSLEMSGAGTAEIVQSAPKLVSLTDGAIVKGIGNNKFKHFNRRFYLNGNVELFGKKFDTNMEVYGGLIYFETSEAEWNDDGTYTEKTFVTTGFVIDSKYVEIQNDYYENVKIVDRQITSVEGVKSGAVIAGNGSANISIVTTEGGSFTIGGKTYKVSGDSDGVTFVTDSSGNVAEINGLTGTIEGNFGNEISVNGKAIQIVGASSIKVDSNGEIITEIANVAGDLTTANDNSYRKNVRVYELGGATKLTTSADGMITFKGNKFETNAGRTFTFDNSGNVLGIEKAQSNDNNSSADVAETEASTSPSVEENFATITLSTTDNLDEITGDFSEGLTVNGVFVRVTDSTNFVVKDDAENVYIETTAQDTFTINGKTFKTYADKTIFKLDDSGNVSEIVTDRFLPDEESYVIDGDFSDEIIFSGRKFHVTGTNKTSLFIRNNSIVCVDLAKNSVEVVESGGAADIAVKGEGKITIGDKTFSTSSNFTGFLQVDSDGKVYSLDYFVGTISGELGGLKLGIEEITINSEDAFSVTGSGGKITALENLQNGSFTCGNLDGLTINGAKVNVDNSEKVKVAVTDGDLKISRLTSGAIASNFGGKVHFVTKEEGEFFIGEDDFKVTGDNSVTFEADDSNKVQKISKLAENASVQTAYGGQFVVNNQTLTAKDEDIFVGLKNNSAKILGGGISAGEISDRFAGDKSTRIIDYVAADGETQKSGYVAHDESLNASTETTGLVIVAEEYSTVLGGKGSDTIYASAGNFINAGAGKNYISLNGGGDAVLEMNGRDVVTGFKNSFDDGDLIKTSTKNLQLQFDGENIIAKNNSARMTLEGVGSDTFTELLLLDGSDTLKTYIAQSGENILATETADAYYGEKSGVDFTGVDDSLVADLKENFNGINRVTLGGGQNTLISSSRNETLTGNGTTEFIFNKNSGRDVIQNFNFDEDRINVGNETITAVNVNSAGGVRMQISGDAVLTLNDAQGKNFKINEFTALVDKNLTYNDAANYFVATERNATLTVGESAEIWLDNSHGKYFSGDIRTLDASTAQGKTSLVGNDSDNTIIAGNGDSSLWGGSGGDDLLVGGTGKNTFFYTNGNGNDTIAGAHDGDVVYLSQINLEQIASTSIAADSVSINFKDGGSLQISGAADVTYQLQDGSKYSANHEQAVWITK